MKHGTKRVKKYTITVTQKQLIVIMNALESYFRTRMNQWFDFATEVAHNGYEYDKENPENDRLFNEYINRRNDSQEAFEVAFNIAAPNLYNRKKTPDMQNAIDIWHVIRYVFYLERPEPKDHCTVDAYPPFQMGDEPLPTIERVES